MTPTTLTAPTTPPPPTFDAAKYKETTRSQWETASEAWHRWAPTLRSWLGPATEHMLDRAGVASGCRVLDVAAGAGDQTLQTAARVGPGGTVLATDISPAILTFAAAEARRNGHANVDTRVMDGEHLELPDASFDVVISRVGLIYFPDQQRALGEMRRVLVPGGTRGGHRVLDARTQSLLQPSRLDRPPPREAGIASAGATGSVQSGWPGRHGRSLHARRLPRRQGRAHRRAPANEVRGPVSQFRARVIWRASPDAVHAGRG